VDIVRWRTQATEFSLVDAAYRIIFHNFSAAEERFLADDFLLAWTGGFNVLQLAVSDGSSVYVTI
jgi:hypothetical protein